MKHRHDLRKLARGQPCLIRVPGVCVADAASTVLCHVRMIGISGIGMKSPDMLAAHGCHACHSAVDGQTKTDYTYEQRRIMLLEGMARTQAWLIEQEIVTW